MRGDRGGTSSRATLRFDWHPENFFSIIGGQLTMIFFLKSSYIHFYRKYDEKLDIYVEKKFLYLKKKKRKIENCFINIVYMWLCNVPRRGAARCGAARSIVLYWLDIDEKFLFCFKI